MRAGWPTSPCGRTSSSIGYASRTCLPSSPGCPLAGVDGEEVADASPLVEATTAMLNGSPEFYNLPRKFKVSITGCRVWCSYPEINDVGLTALRHPDTGQLGFSVRVGGGLSTRPYRGIRRPPW